MTYSQPARTTTHRTPWSPAAGLLVVVVPIAIVLGYLIGTFGYRLVASSPAKAAAPTDVPHGELGRPRLPPPRAVVEAAPPIGAPRGQPRGAPGEADGVVPDGTTVFGDKVPGVARL